MRRALAGSTIRSACPRSIAKTAGVLKIRLAAITGKGARQAPIARLVRQATTADPSRMRPEVINQIRKADLVENQATQPNVRRTIGG